MAWPAPSDLEQSESWRLDHGALRRLRLRVFLRGSAYAIFTGTLLTGLTILLVWQSVQTIHVFRDAQGPNATIELAEFTALRPDLVALSAGIGVLGVVVAAVGIWCLVRTVGPERRPPRTALIGVFMLSAPFLLATGWFAIGAADGTFLVVAGGPLTAVTLWAIPMELTILAVGQLTIAYGSARQRQVFVETSELPTKAVQYFDEVEPGMLEAGLDPIGDVRYDFAKGKCRRLWANPNRTFFASASWFPCGQTTLKAVSVYAVADDGSYLEAANVPNNLFTAPAGCEHLFHNDSDASPEEVLQTFSEMLRSLIEDTGCMPRQVLDDQHEHLGAYGMAWLSRARNAAPNRNPMTDVMWLADPWRWTPLPPLPGQPWHPEEDYASGEPPTSLRIAAR